jgi:hypothetical protein
MLIQKRAEPNSIRHRFGEHCAASLREDNSLRPDRPGLRFPFQQRQKKGQYLPEYQLGRVVRYIREWRPIVVERQLPIRLPIQGVPNERPRSQFFGQSNRAFSNRTCASPSTNKPDQSAGADGSGRGNSTWDCFADWRAKSNIFLPLPPSLLPGRSFWGHFSGDCGY